MARFVGPLLLGLVLGAVVGGAAAWLLFGEGGAGRLPLDVAAKSQDFSTRVRPSEAGSASPPAEAAPLAAPVAVERTSSEASSSAPPAVVESAVELARHAPMPSKLRGSKSIRGRVADPDGKAVGGAVIRARRVQESERSPHRSDAGEAAPGAETLEDAVRDAVEGYYDRESDRRDTTSDAEGRYEFADLRDGRWWLSGWIEGYDVDVTSVGREGITPDATVDLVATPVVFATVRVALPDGATAPRAALQWRKPGEKSYGHAEGWTEKQPRVALSPGTWEIRATLGDPETGPSWPDALASDATKVTIPSGNSGTLGAAGSAPVELVFALHGSPGVRGRVRFPPGDARPYAQVILKPVPAGTAPDLKLLASDHGATNTWSRDGTYLFRDLAPGRYVVGAVRNWNQPIAAHAVVEVRDSMVVQDLEIPPLDPARCLVVKVVGPDGALLEGVSFSIRIDRARRGDWSGGVEAERKQNGNVWVPLDAVNDDDVDLLAPWPEDMKVFLVARTEALGEKSVEFSAGTRALQVKFSSPAMLVATVAGYVGSGYEGRLHLSLDRADLESSRRSFSHVREGIGADGTQKLGPVESGSWRLKLLLQPSSGNQWEQQEITALDLTLAPGENSATIAIPAIYSLTIEVPDATEGYVQIKPVGRDESANRGLQLDASGRITVEGLAAGEYVVTVMAGGEPGFMRVRVPTAGTVRFQAMPVNALVVSIEKEEGRLFKAGFRAGDVVVAIDGKEFSTTMELQGVMVGALSKKDVAFTILRGRDRLEVKLDGREFMNPFELGGSLEPTSR